MYASRTPTLTISNKEMDDIMDIVKSLEESGLPIEELAVQQKIKQNNKKEVFWDASLLRNLFVGKAVHAGDGVTSVRGRNIQRRTGLSMPPQPLTKYYQLSSKNRSKSNGVYSRDNLPKIKDGAYIINLDECKS